MHAGATPLPMDPLIGVRFQCVRCRATAERPAPHLVNAYGCATTADVEARARCLRYIDGARCGGRARVELTDSRPHARMGLGQALAGRL